MAEKHFQQKLSFIEKAGYSLGDGAANFVFMSMILFQLNFYTNTLSIAAGIAGTLLLIGRFWDAFFDPMMGTIADRTNTRWGKFRPWVLWTALPWGVFMVLAYTAPGFDEGGNIAWALITNTILMTLYSANNTPYSAMTAAMTGDVNERTSLSSYRFVAAMLAQLIVGGFTLPLVSKFGGDGNRALGWQMTMGLWAVICVVFFVIAFLTTRERIQPPPQQKSNPKADFKNLLKNGPWVAMFILTLVHFIYVAMRGGVVIYYFQYYVDNNSLFSFLQSIGMPSEGDASSGGLWYFILNGLGFIIRSDHSNVSSVGFSLLNMSSQFITVIGVLFSTYLSIKFGKKLIAILGFGFTSLFMVLFMLLPADAIWATFIMDWLRALTYAPTIPLIWAMFADVVDFSEWKFNRRPAGIIYATILFGLKTGLSLGGFLTGLILGFYGFVPPAPNAIFLPAQSPDTVFGIRMLISIYPTICLVVVVACLFFYKISKKMNLQIQDELAERRKTFATGTA